MRRGLASGCGRLALDTVLRVLQKWLFKLHQVKSRDNWTARVGLLLLFSLLLLVLCMYIQLQWCINEISVMRLERETVTSFDMLLKPILLRPSSYSVCK